MPGEPLAQARVVFDAGGVPYSADFDDVYHSADGGPAQARAVFLGGNDLPARWHDRRSYTILETGFGLGLNFLCCCAELLADPASPQRLNYIAIEKHPPRLEDIARAHEHWGELGATAAELRRRWPPLLRGFHRIDLAANRVSLTVLFGDAAEMLAELDARVDAMFLDGFAPAKNPAMWSQAVFRSLARLSGPGTTAATWSVAAPVRAGLEQAGFEITRRPGFGRKREMLAAIRPGAAPAADTGPRERRAVVIGAGLAGSWVAHALACRGWSVDLLERHDQPALEASGNAVGAIRPALNLADNDNARLARAAFLRTTSLLAHDPAWYGIYGRSGVLHLAATAPHAQRMAAILSEHAFPPQYVRWVEAEEAARLARHRVAGPGWWIADGGWAQPQRLCRALLERVPERVRLLPGAAAHVIARSAAGWQVRDSRNIVLAEAPTLVAANGYEACRLGLTAVPQLIRVRGQVSFLPADGARSLDIVVGGDGYVAPLPQGGHCVGATFEPGAETIELRAEDHERNLERADRLLPGFGRGIDAARLPGWVGVRTATADRLPACGALTETDQALAGAGGRYLVTGLGARGLIWAPLCAEALASQLEGEPNPVELSLLAAMAPQRGLLRAEMLRLQPENLPD